MFSKELRCFGKASLQFAVLFNIFIRQRFEFANMVGYLLKNMSPHLCNGYSLPGILAHLLHSMRILHDRLRRDPLISLKHVYKNAEKSYRKKKISLKYIFQNAEKSYQEKEKPLFLSHIPFQMTENSFIFHHNGQFNVVFF